MEPLRDGDRLLGAEMAGEATSLWLLSQYSEAQQTLQRAETHLAPDDKVGCIPDRHSTQPAAPCNWKWGGHLLCPPGVLRQPLLPMQVVQNMAIAEYCASPSPGALQVLITQLKSCEVRLQLYNSQLQHHAPHRKLSAPKGCTIC